MRLRRETAMSYEGYEEKERAVLSWSEQAGTKEGE